MSLYLFLQVLFIIMLLTTVGVRLYNMVRSFRAKTVYFCVIEKHESLNKVCILTLMVETCRPLSMLIASYEMLCRRVNLLLRQVTRDLCSSEIKCSADGQCDRAASKGRRANGTIFRIHVFQPSSTLYSYFVATFTFIVLKSYNHFNFLALNDPDVWTRHISQLHSKSEITSRGTLVCL